jgi:signal transduction histidine kinase
MLYLRLVALRAGETPERRVPLFDSTAVLLERALLTGDPPRRRSILEKALETDSGFANWALVFAERELNRTINKPEDAAEWLSIGLERILAEFLANEPPLEESDDIQWRLPALVSKLDLLDKQAKEFSKQLEHAKLESLKELAYGASHEINNPLANIAARAQTLLEDELDVERQRKLSAIHRQAMRAHEMIADLMLFARPPKLNHAPCDLSQLVKQVAAEMLPLARELDVELTSTIFDDPIELTADATQLGVAIQAVVKNAIEAARDGGHITITVRKASIDGLASAEVAVKDDGLGIPDDVREHIFDPFFSGREAGRGLGFGLSKCWRIVTDHGGQVIVQKPAAGGAEFVICLPLI